jgi:ABC-type uncharacterized transport system substrate-binding protein
VWIWLTRFCCALMATSMTFARATPASAHPHVWITVETTVLYDSGAFTGLQHKWTFDEFYTAMAIEGLDKNHDGVYDREELAELAKVNIEGLKEFGYFTYVALGGQEVKLANPRDYWLEHKEGTLSLHFTLPFGQPIEPKNDAFAFVVQDPSFFIAFVPSKTDAVKLKKSAPSSCKIRVASPEAGAGEARSFSQIGVSFKHAVTIECIGP